MSKAQQAKERTCFLTTALLGLGEEDASGFRALVGHRSRDYVLLERRGLIYRTMCCVPERCCYWPSHGPVPRFDCLREGWTLSLRGRLVIELLRAGVAFDPAVELAIHHEHKFTATIIIHRSTKSAGIIFAADLPAVRPRRERGLKTTKSTAERAFTGQLARLTYLEELLGDEVSSIQALRSQMASVRYQLRERGKDCA